MVAFVLSLPVEPWMTVAALLAIVGVALSGFWRCTGHGLPALLHVGYDRRITATMRDGRSLEGSILDDSHVGAQITTIVWHADRTSRFSPARTILILRDTLPPDEFRRLRVLLRYGRRVVDEGASGRDAG
jgi:hypothetical protein